MNDILKLVAAEAGVEKYRILVVALISGVVNALAIAAINNAAHSSAGREAPALVVLILNVGVYVWSSRYINHRMVALTEMVTYRIKCRIGAKITRVNLDTLDQIQAAEICDRVTENCANISDTAVVMIAMIQSFFIVVCASSYIMWLSPTAFLITGFLCCIYGLIFFDLRQQIRGEMRKTAMGRLVFFDRIVDLLNGFKEIKFSRKRSRDLLENIDQASDTLRRMAINSSNYGSQGFVVEDLFLVGTLAAVIFSDRNYIGANGATLSTVVASIMFFFGHYQLGLRGYLQHGRANVVLEELHELEKKLDAASTQNARLEDAEDPWEKRISTIEARDLEYIYRDEGGQKNFTIGPINLQFHKGEIVFIVGGNGSGKSTLLRVLTGLSVPTSGTLLVDGVPIDRNNVASFRDMITAIFADFHVYPKIHGLTGIDPAIVNKLIQRMHLEDQTSLKDDTFTKTTLSTGQRKRLAMIVALLEDRPVIAFDEWAAEQDPEFREYFYRELLPELRDEGKIVIVISHDDRYFDCADRVVTMEYGKVRSDQARRPTEVV
ncbi:MAG TPA: cyclic peptide export ABC transporter [Polyangium sp.]|nr:cyclic peptide export ABC transporter [Polyangium sp.]